MKHSIQVIAAGLIALGLALNLGGCSKQSPMQSGDNEIAGSLSKDVIYPQSTSRTLSYVLSQGGYQGGNMQVPNGSTFHLQLNALTPPQGTTLGSDVTLTMLAEKDAARNQLLFSFGPSGCQFNPPAEVWFDWTDLGSKNAKLYYIDSDGVYHEQSPESVDFQGQRMSLRIDHFSRYAVAYSQ